VGSTKPVAMAAAHALVVGAAVAIATPVALVVPVLVSILTGPFGGAVVAGVPAFGVLWLLDAAFRNGLPGSGLRAALPAGVLAFGAFVVCSAQLQLLEDPDAALPSDLAVALWTGGVSAAAVLVTHVLFDRDPPAVGAEPGADDPTTRSPVTTTDGSEPAEPAEPSAPAVPAEQVEPAAPAPERFDHVVVGAGVIGAATARSLARSGASVLLVEQFGRGHDKGSSHGASRIFRRGYAADDWVALTGDAITAWQELEAETGRTLLDFTGALDHGDPAVLDEIQAALERGGVVHERLTPDEAATRWPGLRFDTSVLVHAQAGRVRSADAVEALLDSAAAAGAELRFDTSVAAIETKGVGTEGAETEGAQTEGAETERGDVVLRLEGAGGASSTVVSTSVVLAVGSWARYLAGDLVRRAGASLPPVRVTQEEPAHFATELPDDAWPSFVHHPTDPALRARVSTIYGLLTPGEGVKVGTHGTGREVHPDARLASPGAEGQAVLRDYVSAWVPGVDVDTLAPISCLYDTTPTEDPVLDRVGSVTVATGFSGHGFKFGAVFGELLAGVATGTPAPERFRLRRA